jgi:hypothetical protein
MHQNPNKFQAPKSKQIPSIKIQIHQKTKYHSAFCGMKIAIWQLIKNGVNKSG